MIATRDAYGQALAELAAANKDIVVLDADLSCSTKTCVFAAKYPDRFFNMGIAEQNMVGFAAGLSTAGKTVFASTFAIFGTGRCWEQIRDCVAYTKLDVKIVCSHAGISVGPDGATHQSIEDIGLMRILPNMNVIVPCDGVETKKAIAYAARTKGPFYIRLGRPKVAVITDGQAPFHFGKLLTLKEGKDVALIACGVMVHKAMEAAQVLQKQGVDAAVVNAHTIKPMDAQGLSSIAGAAGAVVTCEEHTVIGGLGGAVSEILAETCPVPVARIGIRDKFGQSGEPEELMKAYHIDTPDIVSAALDVIRQKNKKR